MGARSRLARRLQDAAAPCLALCAVVKLGDAARYAMAHGATVTAWLLFVNLLAVVVLALRAVWELSE